VHDCLNRGYFQLARRVLGAGRVRCATYCGEFSGGWGYSRNWIEPSVDLYFSRTPTARRLRGEKGHRPGETRVRGYLMLPRSHLEVLSPPMRRVFRRSVSASTRTFTVFLATGGNGANNHFAAARAAETRRPVQAIVICGRTRRPSTN
jgi:processive 1,2-diacylglycerol beta-glucosyltransferase